VEFIRQYFIHYLHSSYLNNKNARALLPAPLQLTVPEEYARMKRDLFSRYVEISIGYCILDKKCTNIPSKLRRSGSARQGESGNYNLTQSVVFSVYAFQNEKGSFRRNLEFSSAFLPGQRSVVSIRDITPITGY
jgi:hypothetical protein